MYNRFFTSEMANSLAHHLLGIKRNEMSEQEEQDRPTYNDDITLPRAIRLLGLEIIANIIKDARSKPTLTVQNGRRLEDKSLTRAIQEAKDWIYLDEHEDDRRTIADMAGLEYDYMMKMIIKQVNSNKPVRLNNHLHRQSRQKHPTTL